MGNSTEVLNPISLLESDGDRNPRHNLRSSRRGFPRQLLSSTKRSLQQDFPLTSVEDGPKPIFHEANERCAVKHTSPTMAFRTVATSPLVKAVNCGSKLSRDRFGGSLSRRGFPASCEVGLRLPVRVTYWV